MNQLKGHSDYINCVVFEPETGDLVASAADDHTARLWDAAEGVNLHTFHLNSPGLQLVNNTQ